MDYIAVEKRVVDLHYRAAGNPEYYIDPLPFEDLYNDIGTSPLFGHTVISSESSSEQSGERKYSTPYVKGRLRKIFNYSSKFR